MSVTYMVWNFYKNIFLQISLRYFCLITDILKLIFPLLKILPPNTTIICMVLQVICLECSLNLSDYSYELVGLRFGYLPFVSFAYKSCFGCFFFYFSWEQHEHSNATDISELFLISCLRSNTVRSLKVFSLADTKYLMKEVLINSPKPLQCIVIDSARITWMQ